jgi:molybdate transport system substrate-binding protein
MTATASERHRSRRRQAVASPVLLLAVLPLVLACGSASSSAAMPTPPGQPAQVQGGLTIFAATSLTDAFNEIKTTLEASPAKPRITFSYAGSSQLRAQLAQGARADLFVSADERTMEGARQDGSIAGSPAIFAQNRLVVVVPAGNPAKIGTLRDLANPGVKLVLAQEQVPVGGYARQALDQMSRDPAFGSDFKARVLANLASDETNVRAVLAKVQLGEADAGIVYVTDAAGVSGVGAAGSSGRVTTIDIPDRYNVIARYPVAVVKGAPNAAGARAFVDYLLSPPGQQILAKYGFLPPDDRPSTRLDREQTNAG